MTEIYIGDNLLDLYPKTVLAVTVQKIEIADLRGRNVNYSNAINAPWTENNARMFGYAYDEQSDTSIPYTQQNCRIIQNGVTLPLTICIIVKSEKKDFNLTFYEDIFDFFQSVNDQSITDVVPITNSSWEAGGIDTARTNTTGIISAILNWGKSGAIFQLNYFLPCFHYHTFVTGILNSTGLVASGSILTNDDYLDLVIPYYAEDFNYAESNIIPYFGKVNNSTATNIGMILVATRKVPFDTTEYGTYFDLPSDTYIFDNAVYGTFTAVIQVNAITWRLATYLRIQIYVNGTPVALYQVNFPTTDSGVQTITYTGQFLSGDVVDVRLTTDAAAIPDGADCTVVSGWTFAFAPTTDVVRASVNWNNLLPPITCRELLTDFFNRFGIIPKQVGLTLILKTIEEIILDRTNAVNWSGKLVNPDNYTITYDSNYAQSNYFGYDKSEDVNDPNLGRGSIDVANTNLDNAKTIYTSLFGNSLTEEVVSGYNVATIPVYDSTSTDIDTFAEKPGLRLLTLKDRTTEAAITFDASARTDYRLAYFVDPSLTKDTGFEYFLSQHYAALERSLQKNKVIEKYFLLTDYDISIFDPHKMIWDGNAYYIVNKIQNFVSGRVTKVVLFKTS